MKSEICRCNLQGKEAADGKWWKWIETCDRCGVVIRDHTWVCSEEPDISEADYCIDCLHCLINNRNKV